MAWTSLDKLLNDCNIIKNIKTTRSWIIENQNTEPLGVMFWEGGIWGVKFIALDNSKGMNI